MECADLVVKLYGIRKLVADIDYGRFHAAEDGGVVASILNWLMDEGFYEFFDRFDAPWAWKDISEFRARHVTKYLKR